MTEDQDRLADLDLRIIYALQQMTIVQKELTEAHLDGLPTSGLDRMLQTMGLALEAMDAYRAQLQAAIKRDRTLGETAPPLKLVGKST